MPQQPRQPAQSGQDDLAGFPDHTGTDSAPIRTSSAPNTHDAPPQPGVSRGLMILLGNALPATGAFSTERSTTRDQPTRPQVINGASSSVSPIPGRSFPLRSAGFVGTASGHTAPILPFWINSTTSNSNTSSSTATRATPRSPSIDEDRPLPNPMPVSPTPATDPPNTIPPTQLQAEARSQMTDTEMMRLGARFFSSPVCMQYLVREYITRYPPGQFFRDRTPPTMQVHFTIDGDTPEGVNVMRPNVHELVSMFHWTIAPGAVAPGAAIISTNQPRPLAPLPVRAQAPTIPVARSSSTSERRSRRSSVPSTVGTYSLNLSAPVTADGAPAPITRESVFGPSGTMSMSTTTGLNNPGRHSAHTSGRAFSFGGSATARPTGLVQTSRDTGARASAGVGPSLDPSRDRQGGAEFPGGRDGSSLPEFISATLQQLGQVAEIRRASSSNNTRPSNSENRHTTGRPPLSTNATRHTQQAMQYPHYEDGDSDENDGPPPLEPMPFNQTRRTSAESNRPSSYTPRGPTRRAHPRMPVLDDEDSDGPPPLIPVTGPPRVFPMRLNNNNHNNNVNNNNNNNNNNDYDSDGPPPLIPVRPRLSGQSIGPPPTNTGPTRLPRVQNRDGDMQDRLTQLARWARHEASALELSSSSETDVPPVRAATTSRRAPPPPPSYSQSDNDMPALEPVRHRATRNPAPVHHEMPIFSGEESRLIREARQRDEAVDPIMPGLQSVSASENSDDDDEDMWQTDDDFDAGIPRAPRTGTHARRSQPPTAPLHPSDRHAPANLARTASFERSAAVLQHLLGTVPYAHLHAHAHHHHDHDHGPLPEPPSPHDFNDGLAFLRNMVEGLPPGSDWVDLISNGQIFGFGAGGLGPTEEPDPARARELVAGLYVIPPEFVDRLEAIEAKEIEVAEGEREGGRGCSVCWEGYSLFSDDPSVPASEDQVLCMPCLHIFHRRCLEPWLAMHSTCPVCRFDIDPQSATHRYARSLDPQRHPRWIVPKGTKTLIQWIEEHEAILGIARPYIDELD